MIKDFLRELECSNITPTQTREARGLVSTSICEAGSPINPNNVTVKLIKL